MTRKSLFCAEEKDWINSAVVQSQDPEERGLLK